MGETLKDTVVLLGKMFCFTAAKAIALNWYPLLPLLSSNPAVVLCWCAAWGVHGQHAKVKEGVTGDC